MDYKVKTVYGKIKNKNAVVRVPGSKSITARALLIAALANGESTLYGAQFSDDCATFAEAVKSLGIGVSVDGNTVKIVGCGGRLSVKSGEVYVGSAGTAARFLTAMLALYDGQFKMTSSEQMQRRPQAALINALKELGAEFIFSGEENCFPFVVRGASNPADSVTVDITKSSQFLSALLMAGVLVGKPFKIKTAGSHGLDYVKMTLDMMWSFGVNVGEENGVYTVSGAYSAKKYDIEPDVSAACYFYALNRLLGTNVKVAGVMPHTMQGDIKFARMINGFDGGNVDMSAFSDQALTLAAVAPYLSKPTQISGIAHVRGQECDRINAIVHNLTAMGVKCKETADGVIIYPCANPHGVEIETYGDHRVAMAFALIGLRTEGIIIKNAEVCSKTFKEYFSVLDKLCKELTE